jgi:hypothetical protein
MSVFAVLTLIIIGLFVVLSPKVSSLLFPIKRQAILNDFISKTKLAGRIDPQSYWQFREFYSPGYFTFSRTGIEKSLLDKAKKEINISYDEKGIDLFPLFFSSRWLNSLDMLTKQKDLNSLISEMQIQNNKIIFMSNNSIIYKDGQNTIKIVFLLSNNDMQTANGFFDYKEKDKIITQNENWFNVTSLRLD